LLRNEQKAVDAAHDVFVRVLRNERRLHSENPTSLLLKIATNVCLNALRTERRRPEDPADERLLEIAAVDEPEARSAARSALRRIFAREQESTRTIAVMHLVDGLTLEEVAEEVGLSVSGVRKRLRTLSGRVAALKEVEL
jgi:RNA polymerase sigma-70 factor (ECF subfamily)